MNTAIATLFQQYIDKAPEIVFEWNDAQTEARGWVVINSLRNGAAGGGTRMRKGLTKDEVVSLAKVMEIKFAVCGPDIGGGKSGIDFDPSDPRREEVLERWYKAVYPLLKTYYGTGGDLNVDELRDVVPITEKLGLWHPQEGIVNGHFHASQGQAVSILGQLRHGCTKVVEDPRFAPEGYKYAVADLITGYGVAESVRHYYQLYHQLSDLKGKKVIVQGWGNVASNAAIYLALQGAAIVGIIDRDGGILRPEGIPFDELKHLFLTKDGNKLVARDMMPFKALNEQIWTVGAEIFIPGAASRLVSRDQAEQMIANGLECIACGANVPFVDDQVLMGPTAQWVDTQVALLPDFIANCGMARVFAYLMNPNARITDEAIFSDVSQTIETALKDLQGLEPQPRNMAMNALNKVLTKIMDLKLQPI